MSDDWNDYLSEGVTLNESAMWAVKEGCFFAPSTTTHKITPGAYNIMHDYQMGVHFSPASISTEDLVVFDDSAADKILNEIEEFWKLRDRFEKLSIPFKRGIFLYGPPGTGKSSVIRQLVRNIIRLGGVAISSWPGVGMFNAGLHLLRKIQPDIPIIVLMEDFDSLLERESRSDILQMLDGAEKIDNIVFIATTNDIDAFDQNIINRPSRFDRRIYIGYPSADHRRAYLAHLFGKLEIDEDLTDLVEKTSGFTISHLKELVVSAYVLKNDLDTVIEDLRKMMDDPEDDEDEDEDEDDDNMPKSLREPIEETFGSEEDYEA